MIGGARRTRRGGRSRRRGGMKGSQNLALNGVTVPFRAVGAAAGSAVTKFTGRKRVAPFFGYSDTAQVTMTMTEPLFCTVLAVEYKVSTGA